MVDMRVGRHCAICGRVGGSGMTYALRLLGYPIPAGEIGYAHAPCVIKARRRQRPTTVVPVEPSTLRHKAERLMSLAYLDLLGGHRHPTVDNLP